MAAWIAPLGFALLTALFVVQHIRARAGGASHTASACPRCRAMVPEGRTHCPSCRAPIQAFAVVTAPQAAVADPSNGPQALHAVVRADACAGCGTCVAACPEVGAIRIENRIAIVDREACKGHGECVTACPVGAIFMTEGESVQMVEVPDLNEHFESRDVPGLYIIEIGRAHV